MAGIMDELGFESQGINSKKKGDRNEARVAKWLSKWTGEEFVRIPRSGGLRWKNRMDICGDVINTNPEFNFPFEIEAKHFKKLYLPDKLKNNSAVYRLWKQVEDDSKASNKYPTLWIRVNSMPRDTWFIFMDRVIFNNEIWPHISGDKLGLYGYASNQIGELTFNNFLKMYEDGA